MASDLDCGLNTIESFANYDPDTYSWKTSQPSLFGEWMSYSETWPRAGMMQSGNAYRLRPLAPGTDVTGHSLLPTPIKELMDMWNSASLKQRGRRKRDSGAHIGTNLSWSLALWHLQNGHSRDDSLIPDPCFYETMMGFPLGWTDLEQSETP